MATQEEITPAQIEALIKERWSASKVTFKGATPIEDIFNEVTKEPGGQPDYAWYVFHAR
jgi:hypothetical protein